MCGIVGYIGNRDAYPIVLNGLKRLRIQRATTALGFALYDGTKIQLCKTKGKVADLEEKFSSQMATKGKIGIGHTRWATHGVPNEYQLTPSLFEQR
jgi:glucosamine--fructose-6-phosphate aminotransferase (isomerizing)